MTRLPMAVVGVGHLGKEHARIVAGLPEAELVGIVDANAAQAELIAGRCGTRAFSDHRDLFGRVAAAVIATPTLYHHAVAREFLRAGVSLLVEKPLASNLAQAEELVQLAQQNRVTLQVGHIERFNPAFEEVQSRPLSARYLICERCGSFTGRSTDVGVVLDLMIHDLDLVLALVRAPVARVEALGMAMLGGHEDVAQARVTFANGCVADLHSSRVHPEAKRLMRVWASEGFATVDFSTRKVTFTQQAEHLRQGRVDSCRLDPGMQGSLKNDLFTCHLPTKELDLSGKYSTDQLTRELQEFVSCVTTGGVPRVHGEAGRDAMALASAILDRIRVHAWEGREDGPHGPHELPAPKGWLFAPASREAA